MSVIRSPLREICVLTLLPKPTEPLMVCWMDSTAKLVYRRYTVLKNVIWGFPVRYTSWAPYATSCESPPAILVYIFSKYFFFEF
ncbi:hypothetical protein MT325_m464R [Paramecium bursaria chlorella virus MT325]|uniref:Uncharacterized protein m464R n=1 Tax=Paramecium bursaria Chlorella virus MT325 TaxID=346932 RepID=A7IUJ4_PBCVM|nr:hypothetical protein MT325_m464R [Paramecium bursaria chlorella virus MT325]